nr:DUF6522 family protein [Defluviimonas salinarum]
MRLEPQGDGFAIAAEDLARAFGLSAAEVRGLMQQGDIVTRFERGEGADAGRSRLTFRFGTKRLRLTVDAAGTVLYQSGIGLASPGARSGT